MGRIRMSGGEARMLIASGAPTKINDSAESTYRTRSDGIGWPRDLLAQALGKRPSMIVADATHNVLSPQAYPLKAR